MANIVDGLQGGGTLALRIQRHPWADTPLGPIGHWPPELRTLTGVMLGSKQPMFTVWGADGVLLYNDAYCDILGHKDGDALGRPFLQVWSEARGDLAPLVNRAFAGEAVHMDDITLMLSRRGRDDEAHFAFSYTPVRDLSGSVQGFFCACNETTDQVMATRRQAFRFELEVALRDLDEPEPVIGTASRAVKEFFGAEEVRFSEDAGAASIPSEAADADGKRAAVTVSVSRAGRVQACLSVGMAMPRIWSPDELDLLHDVVQRVHDVLQRLRALAEARSSEARFRTLTRAMLTQVWTSTPSGTVDWINERAAEFLGTAETVPFADGWAGTVHPDDAPATDERWRQALTSGMVYEDEFRLRRADGMYRWHLSRAVAEHGPDGRIVRWVGTNTDIDGQKRAELDLVDAKSSAEEANLAKSAFIANMSHELRTPLSAIIGYSEMMAEEMQDGCEPGDLVDDMAKVEANARHLLGLINDVLDLSKVESGKMDVFAEPFDVAAVLQEVASTVDTLVAKKNNVLKLELAPDLGSMTSDVVKVRQVLLNLLSNSAKFTENGVITLSASRSAAGGTETMLMEVRDTGIGMTAEQLGKLFQRFAQADASTTRRFGGTGLGLSLARAFADMLGGEVTVESVSGAGSVFSVRIPVHYVPKAEDHAEPEPHAAAGPNDGDRDLMLVIDDDADQRALITRFLHREGFPVQVAFNGRAGLELARRLMPRAILLDVMMPGIDGWSVLTELKRDPVLSSIPVVMVTATDQRSLAASLGASDYMLKPIDWDRFREVVNRFRTAQGGILLVEDDFVSRLDMTGVLEAEGWIVIEAANGQEGLDRAAERHPSLVLLDLNMPVLDGFEFLESLRRIPGCENIPVIVLTAQDLNRSDRQRLRGASQILNKGDVSLQDLTERLRSLGETAGTAG